MRNKILVGFITLIGIGLIGYKYNDTMQASGMIIGSNNHEAGNSLKLGDQVHMGGSALTDDLHTVLGTKDDYIYLLRKSSANNGAVSNYTNALNYANNTYKTKLGAVGSSYISKAGNAVSLISKSELNNLGIVSSNALVSEIPQMSGNWWLKDADTSANRASYMTGTNSLLGTNKIKQTTVSGVTSSYEGGTCGITSTSETGILPINQVTQPQVLKHHDLIDAKFTYSVNAPTYYYRGFTSTDCTGTPLGEGTIPAETGLSKYVQFTKDTSGKETWTKAGGVGGNNTLALLVLHNGYRPRVIGDTSTMTVNAGQCYRLTDTKGNTEVISNIKSIMYGKTPAPPTFSIRITAITDTKYKDYYCEGQTTSAGSALIRPYLKIALNDILMRNTDKRTYSPSSVLNESNLPSSDNAGEYLTIQTDMIQTSLRNGADGVSGNQFVTSKPRSGTVISLPLSFSGPVEGNRYLSAEAIDKDGNTVYGVLKSVGSAASDNVDIDFGNLLSDGNNSFEVTLYLEDAGSKNTAYRSEGTTITVQFQNSDYSLSFTNPDVTNIKIGSADLKETITTDNPEISAVAPNAAVYTLSGGISGTGLSVANDPSDPKGFVISIGNTPNLGLPADFTLTAELETANSNKATATKQIHVFQEMIDFKWIPKKAGSYDTTEVGSNVLLGNLEVQNGLPKYSYSLTSPSDSGYDASKARDNSNFTVTNTALGAGEKAEVKTNTALLPGTYYIQCKVTDSYGDVNYTDFTITVSANEQAFIYTDISGTQLPISGNDYLPYSEVYAPNKTFQLYTAGNPTGSSVTYQLKAGSPTDVISVDANGLVTILNASLNNQMGKVIVQATSHDPSGNYSDKTIELPINIEKGTRIISFKEKPIYVTNGKGKVTPVTEVNGVVDTDGDVLIEVDTNEDHTIAWTNDNKSVDYNYSGDTGIDIKIHATKPMNRNYKAAEADGTIHIMGPDENILAITSPGQIIYGDHFTIRSSQYDADSTNVQYTFEVDKMTYISNPTVNGNSAEFDAKQFSGSNKTIITVTRTADGETMLSKQVQVTVLPKPIEIIIDDKEKLKGEVNPTLTYQDFSSDLVSWNGVQDVIQENDIKLSTTAKTDSNAGTYPIKGDSSSLNKAYPNYSFTFKEGTLKITEETNEDDWYHLELDDGNNTAYTGEWTNQDVNIISDHNEYINLSLDQSTWKPNQVTVSKEGETNQSFWMKKDSGAITKEKQEIIKIDKTAPKVKNIKAKDTNNKLQDIINKLSGGIFFKPGTSFEITTDDTKDDLKVSGTKEISYKVYKTEKQSRAGDELIKEGNLAVTNEKASITISETMGTYKVCVIPSDHAGNTNTESCHEVDLKKIDVDVDGDGKPDFNDPDGDGCPDLNIKWKDPDDETKWIVINGDRDYDGLPDLNIDSDGDGKPDLNVDTDNDGKPDLNLVILKKSDWKPTKCVKADPDNGILEEYCTGTSVKAVLNVDTDNDGIPNINIDSDGDMKADINISKDGINPNINIVELTNWIPDKNYTYQKFSYDTMKDIKPLLNIDSDKDGRPDINIDLDGDSNPDINIDVDGDGIPDIDIDSDGDGKPDVNIDTDGDGKPNENIHEITKWKPNKNVDGDLPYDTMDFSEPTKPTEPNPSVKGQYNPKTSIGGAITGDDTNLIVYISLTMLTFSVISYLLYKYKKNTFQ